MKEKILLMHVHSSMNIGDDALLLSALQQLAASFTDSQVTLSVNDPGSYHGAERVAPSIASWVHPITPQGDIQWKIGRFVGLLPATLLPVCSHRLFGKVFLWFTPFGLRDIIRAILDADLVVGAPGGYLYSSGRGVSLFLALYSFFLAILADKPVYLLPQSIGPIQHIWERWQLHWLLDRARIVMVREPVSLRLIEVCQVRNPNVHLVPDLAFGLPAPEEETDDAWLRQLGIDPQEDRSKLGMTLINWGAQDIRYQWQVRYEQACIAAARWFVEETGGHVFLFPQVWGPTADQDDRVPARRVAGQLRAEHDSIHLIEQPMSMNQLWSLYGRMDLFIGTRMHSNIFALRKGVPVIAIGYQHKTQGILELMGLSKWLIEIQQVDDKILVNRLEALWQARHVWREHIQKVIPTLIHQAQQAGKMVLDDYVSFHR